VNLEMNVIPTTYTSTLLTPGTTYKFKVEARNEFGYSLPSEEVEILASEIPATP
jgi:hypothetical protein